MKYTKEEAKIGIQKLVEKYNRLSTEGKLDAFNEQRTKGEFIEPLFEYLNWDFSNENEEEVYPEDNVSKGRVDYAFKPGGVTKFFLEAKALKGDLENTKFAEQAITYGWHKGVTWAVLTNFEGLKVFNCEWKDKNLWQNVVFQFHCAQYAEEFEKLWLLSRDSFLANELDKYAEKIAKKVPRKKISEQLLEELTGWRRALSSDLSKKYREHYSEDDLDEIVQRILDRLLFIRNCEDRGFEERKLYYLQQEWKERGKNPGAALIAMFRDYDQSYNSKLFEPHDADKVEIEPETLGKVLEGLYYTQDHNIQYDFSIIDADILGNLYEQYLGHLLKKTAKRAKVEEKHAHRKEQGIYYTPTYIVEYIVENTIGELLKEGADPKKIRILDPACGSGSFLIKAFDRLYAERTKNKKVKQATLDAEDWFSQKVDILKNNIFGVDLDPKAVEIAQLNLLLKAAEKKHRLPTLKQNIKCGNSLIDDPAVSPRAFKWEEEFKEIMGTGGFDAVIGNPPYVRVDNLDKKEKEYWKKTFGSAQGKYDLYYLFIENVFEQLKSGGKCGFIVPNKFCAASSAKKLRELIISSSSHCNIISVSHLDVFKDASNYPLILILKKGINMKKIKVSSAMKREDFLNKTFVSYELDNDALKILPSNIIPININQKQLDLVIKLLRKNERVSCYLKISEGLRIPEKLESSKKDTYEIVKQFQFSKWTPVTRGSYISENDLKEVISITSDRYTNSLKDKVVIAEDALSINATLDDKQRIPQGGVYFGVMIREDVSLKYVISLLNSKLLSFTYKTLFGGMHMGGGYLRYRTEFLEQLPINVPSDTHQKHLINLADKMLSLNGRLSEMGDRQTDERKRLEEEIEKTDALIDGKVYELYGLTGAEIKIVEESLK